MRLVAILVGLLWLTFAPAQDNFPDVPQSPWAGRLPGQIDADLDRAVALWKQFKMPIPPLDAVPIHIENGQSGNKTNYRIGFLATRKGKPDLVYTGTRVFDRSSKDLNAIKKASWNVSDAVDMQVPWFATFGFPEDTNIAGAVLATLLHHRDFARMILKSQNMDGWRFAPDSSWIGTPVDTTAYAGTGFLIATHFVNELAKPEVDRVAIRDKIAAIYRLNLVKKSPMWPDRDLREVLKDLDETVRPSRAKPGTVEFAVDDLVNCTEYRGWGRNDNEPRIQLVKSFGLAAVPALAKALEGRKLTRSFRTRFNNADPTIVPVSWVAADTLRQIAGGELGDFEGFTGKQALAWYQAKISGKVEAFLLDSVVEDRTIDGRTFRVLSDRTFSAIALTHPKLYGEAVRRFLRVKPPMSPWNALWSLDQTNLPRADKRAIYLESAESKDLDQRFAAMRFLHKYAPDDFDRILAETFHNYLRIDSQSYSQFAWLIAETDNPTSWAAFAEILPKVSTETRMEMLAVISGFEPEKNLKEGARTQALSLLAKFFGDESRPKIVKGNPRFGGNLWLRNLAGLSTVGHAALEIAGRLLGMPEMSEEGRTESEWAEFRKKVEQNIRVWEFGWANPGSLA